MSGDLRIAASYGPHSKNRERSSVAVGGWVFTESEKREALRLDAEERAFDVTGLAQQVDF